MQGISVCRVLERRGRLREGEEEGKCIYLGLLEIDLLLRGFVVIFQYPQAIKIMWIVAFHWKVRDDR